MENEHVVVKYKYTQELDEKFPMREPHSVIKFELYDKETKKTTYYTKRVNVDGMYDFDEKHIKLNKSR